jgi:hypothetical protein
MPPLINADFNFQAVFGDYAIQRGVNEFNIFKHRDFTQVKTNSAQFTAGYQKQLVGAYA